MILKDKIDPGKRSFIRVVVFIVLLLFSFRASSQPLQELTLSGQVKLSGQLSEISGMVYHDGTVYAINDSWNQAEIYALEFGSFEIKEVFKLGAVVNKDWEEITIYNEKLYIGDFGNNFGNRRDLSVHIIALSELRKDDQEIRSVRFSYKDQVTFSGIPYNHRWDCEAMFVDSSGIHLFSKNRESKTTSRFDLPNNFEDGQVSPVSSFNTGFIVTGAFNINEEGRLYLVGYRNQKTYLVIFNDNC